MTYFIGVDGEAIEDIYCLLTVGSQTLYRREGISLEQAAEFLLRNIPKDAFAVAFAFHYDVCMLARDLPDDAIIALMHGLPIQVGEYTIRYWPKRMLAIKRKKRRVVVYDTWTFFGASFESALESMGFEVPAIIRWGKAHRSVFSFEDLDRIVEYNQTECAMLERLCERLDEAMRSVGLDLQSWHGPGALASKLIKAEDVKAEIAKRDTIEDIALAAYYGGRVELFQLGRFEDISVSDINSAYPWAATFLWDQSGLGTWREVRGWTVSHPWSVWEVEWTLPAGSIVGPFPFRLRSGRIWFPTNGSGWYWYPEVEAALLLFGNRIKIRRGYIWTGESRSRLSFIIPELYAKRKQLEQEGKHLEAKVLKLVLNALYGKFAQSIGRAPFNSYAWAGYITSMTRALLLETIMRDPYRVVAVATDGIFWEGDPPRLRESDALGGWKIDKGFSGWVLGAGMYYLQNGQKVKQGNRGGNWDWVAAIRSLAQKGYIETQDELFVTPLLAVRFPQAYGEYKCKWIVRDRILAPWSVPEAKRHYHILSVRDLTQEICTSHARTLPAIGSMPRSQPYTPKPPLDYVLDKARV